MQDGRCSAGLQRWAAVPGRPSGAARGWLQALHKTLQSTCSHAAHQQRLHIVLAQPGRQACAGAWQGWGPAGGHVRHRSQRVGHSCCPLPAATLAALAAAPLTRVGGVGVV